MPEFTIAPHLFQVLLRERLRLPLFLTESICQGCHEPLDPLGHQRAACPHSGHTQKRATPVERVMARICREAGARVKFNAFLKDMNVSVPTSDLRRIEVLAQDLPCFGGAQLAVDVLSEALSRGMERLSPGPQKRMAQSCCKLGSTRKTSTQNSSTGDVGSWLWLWKREAGGAVRLWTSSGSSPRPKPGKSHPSFLTKRHWCGIADGQGC